MLTIVCTGAVGDEVRLPDGGVQSRTLHPPQPAHGLWAHQAAEGPRWGTDFSSSSRIYASCHTCDHRPAVTRPPTLNWPHPPAFIHTSFNPIIRPVCLRASRTGCCWEFYPLNVFEMLHGLFLSHFLCFYSLPSLVFFFMCVCFCLWSDLIPYATELFGPVGRWCSLHLSCTIKAAMFAPLSDLPCDTFFSYRTHPANL